MALIKRIAIEETKEYGHNNPMSGGQKMQGKMIYCNKCGRPICMEEAVEKADYIKIEKNWGYFSNKDGVCQHINICEECYDEYIETLQIPPQEKENTELL